MIDVRPSQAQQASPLQGDLPGQWARGARATIARHRRRFEDVGPGRLAARFACGRGDRVDDLPTYRVVTAEPVGSAIPSGVSQVVREARIEVRRNLALHIGRPISGKVGRPDRQHGRRVFALGREVLGPVQPQQVFDRRVGQTIQQRCVPAQGRGGDP